MMRRSLLAAGLGLPLVARAEGGGAPIFAAGATQDAVTELQRGLRATGRPMPGALFDTVGAIRDRILAGERPAVTLLSAEAIRALEGRGLLVAGAVAEVGRTGVGLAAPAGRPAPEIGTAEAFRATLLSADSIAVADPERGATAGRHFFAVLDRLGLSEALRPRLRLVPFGGEGVDMAARGEVALAVSQATEILRRPGVQLVGLLPEELNLWTAYRVAIVQDGPEARALFALLTGEAARDAFAHSGFIPADGPQPVRR
ncbi:molybdate ABC transporter substrate-binding protein [Roseomonas sp. CCTCC AB2023176]|uniref:molybdate ABC transporter substrate-binding protein n=1 Tax=Roseomonas sp. CCTCC AB2023176 TaxID=3342640 RepID=UPI0035DD4E0B